MSRWVVLRVCKWVNDPKKILHIFRLGGANDDNIFFNIWNWKRANDNNMFFFYYLFLLKFFAFKGERNRRYTHKKERFMGKVRRYGLILLTVWWHWISVCLLAMWYIGRHYTQYQKREYHNQDPFLFYNLKLLNDYKAGFIFKITIITLSRNVIYQEYFVIPCILLLLPIHIEVKLDLQMHRYKWPLL